MTTRRALIVAFMTLFIGAGTASCGFEYFPPTGIYATAAPGGLPAAAGLRVSVSSDAVHLTWDPVAGAVSYAVWRDGQQIAEVPAATSSVPLPPPGDYLYQVVAYGTAQVPGVISAPVAIHVGPSPT